MNIVRRASPRIQVLTPAPVRVGQLRTRATLFGDTIRRFRKVLEQVTAQETRPVAAPRPASPIPTFGTIEPGTGVPIEHAPSMIPIWMAPQLRRPSRSGGGRLTWATMTFPAASLFGILGV